MWHFLSSIFPLLFLCSIYAWSICVQFFSWSKPLLQWFWGGSCTIQRDCATSKLIGCASCLLFITRESTKLFIDSWFCDKRTTWLFTCYCLFLLLCFVFISPSHYCMLCASESIRDLDSEMVDIVHLNLLSLICFV